MDIADVVVRVREVTLPDCCPECGHTQFRMMRLDFSFYTLQKDGSLKPDPGDNTIETDYPPVGVLCAECNHTIVMGRVRVVELQGLEDYEQSSWALALDRVFFHG